MLFGAWDIPHVSLDRFEVIRKISYLCDVCHIFGYFRKLESNFSAYKEGIKWPRDVF